MYKHKFPPLFSELRHLILMSSLGCPLIGRLLKTRRVCQRKDGHNLSLFLLLFFSLGIYYQPLFELFFLVCGIGNRSFSCCDLPCQVATSWCCRSPVKPLIYGKILLLVRGKGDEGGNKIRMGKKCPSVWKNTVRKARKIRA